VIGRDWLVLAVTIGIVTFSLSYIVNAMRRDQRNRHKLEKLHDYLTSDREEDHKETPS